MRILLTCPHGHRWELAGGDLGSVPAEGVACPVCGAGSVRAAPGETTGPAPTLSAPETAAALSLPAIPGYEVLGRLGHGGMGVVYKSRQVSLNRTVALKMILAGAHASPERLARFHIEAEALASLQHPNIVQIHEVGAHDGCPYLALEFVDGLPLDKMLAGTPLPPAAAARLVRTLAEAMHYAHQRGLVHRDLKPANVLLATCGLASGAKAQVAEWGPKITDFGLAKRLEEDGRTQTGAILGTPNYMAPEQAEGRVRDIGPATDVYALGAILYELLTGRPPFGGDTVLQTLELVRTQEPKPPSRLGRAVPRDLETICLKCLHKAPARRYPTAQALAEDLRRFLAGEPITARPVGAPERAVKWVRRRPALAGLLAVSAAAALALLALGAWSDVRQRAAAERALARSRLARRAVDDMYTQVALQWLADEPHKDDLQRAFLQKALAIYEELAHDEGGDPSGLKETAVAYFHVGRICQELGDREQARQAYVRALALQQRLVAAQPRDASARHDLAETCTWLGELRRTGRGPLAEAEGAYRQALALQERLVADFPGEPAYRADQARSYYNLGLAHMDGGRPAEAADDYGRAIALLDGLRGRFPDDPRYRQELARSLADRAILHRGQGRLAAAEADGRRAIDLLTPLRAGPQSRPAYRLELAVYYGNLGNLLLAQERSAEARDAYEQALALLRALADDFPERPGYRYELANTSNGLAALLATTGQGDEAGRRWEEARVLLDGLAGRYPEEADYQLGLARALGNLGWLRLRQGDMRAARGFLKGGSAKLEALLAANPEHPAYLEAFRNQNRDLATVLVRLGEQEEAARRAAVLSRSLPPPQGVRLAAAFLACCASAAESAPEVEAAERQALARRYADQALTLLQTAVHDGHASAAWLEGDPTLTPLRGRADFRQLLAEAGSSRGRGASPAQSGAAP